MRKYYSTGGLQAQSATQILDNKVDIWGVYDAFIRGSASIVGFNTVATCLSFIKNKDVEAMLKFSKDLDDRLIEYTGTTPILLVRVERQLVSLLKKYPFASDESSLNPRATAELNLRAAEVSCRVVNERLRAVERPDIPSWVPRAQQLIAETLGDLVPELIMKIISSGTHGPGATLSSVGDRTTPYYKYMDLPYTCTKNALPYAYAAMSSNPKWVDLLESKGPRKSIPPLGCPQYQKELTLFDSCVDVVKHDRITFVPKDASKERPIAIGASLNMYLQLGVKSHMQSCLKKVGVDLTDQSKNQKMAYAGSRFAFCNGLENPEQFSTIDLSNASDTISIEIVKLLLDPLWFSFLSDLRHESGELDAELISYEKFSAMGNGFTFPLESLIFWAIAKAVTLEIKPTSSSRDIAVYGDDIIVRKWAATETIAALLWAGFQLNTEKSFISGHFKESCGADFYRGHNVRPLYIKRQILTIEDVYFVCNSIADISMRDGINPGLSLMYQHLLKHIPRNLVRVQPLSTTSDTSLRVPLSQVSSLLGSRPFLSSQEFDRLQLSGLICKNESYRPYDPYTWQENYVALTYKGQERARLFIALTDSTFDFAHISCVKSLAVLEAQSQTLITRRKSVKSVVTVCAHSSWNGRRTECEMLQHPSRWMK